MRRVCENPNCQCRNIIVETNSTFCIYCGFGIKETTSSLTPLLRCENCDAEANPGTNFVVNVDIIYYKKLLLTNNKNILPECAPHLGFLFIKFLSFTPAANWSDFIFSFLFVIPCRDMGSRKMVLGFPLSRE